jgi:DNA polymerase III subunit delta'
LVIPLYGHAELRSDLLDSFRRNALPQSLLLHGPAGIGKQRLALWLAQTLVCEATTADGPCGNCRHCRMALDLTHPDIYWVFPLPRPRDSDYTPNDAKNDYNEARQDRAKAGGVYPPPSGSDGIYIATTRMLLLAASVTPALARRKVFIVGNAERMVSQLGSEQAANAFLKLLEEPPNDTRIVLTSSAAGDLLPTIRSRVAPIRVRPLAGSEVRAVVTHEAFASALKAMGVKESVDALLQRALGAPGSLLASKNDAALRTRAAAVVDAATSADPSRRYIVALQQGGWGARGGFSDLLDAVTGQLHQAAREAVIAGDSDRAVRYARAVELVEDAKETTLTNVNPSLVTADLVERLAQSLRP